MTRTGRTAVRAVIIAFGVVMAVVFGVTAVGATLDVAKVEAPDRNALLLSALGAWLKVIGIIGLYVTQAVSFQDWPTFARPFTGVSGRLGGCRGLRRAKRQIDGEEPYASAEVARLRSIARYRIDLRQTGLNRATRLGSVSLIIFFLGLVLQPPLDVLGIGAQQAFARAFKGLAVVMIVVLGASLAFPRKRVDEKAEAFLALTSDPHHPEPDLWSPDST